MKQATTLQGWAATSRLPLVGLGLLVFLADQISKGWAQGLPEQLPFVVMPNLQVVRVENPGIAFSLFAQAAPAWRLGLVLVSGLVLLGVAWQVFRRPLARCAEAGLVMILSGAAGNLMDRLLFGRVTDFLQVSAGRHEGPIFNVADMAITTGATMLIRANLRDRASVDGEPAPVGDH
jgi:signal peptidase II